MADDEQPQPPPEIRKLLTEAQLAGWRDEPFTFVMLEGGHTIELGARLAWLIVQRSMRTDQYAARYGVGVTPDRVVAVALTQEQAERVARAMCAAEAPNGPAAWWREEFEYVRKERDELISKLIDARERERGAGLRERRFRESLEQMVDGVLQVEEFDSTRTACCRACQMIGAREDIQTIAHASTCPVTDALVTLGMEYHRQKQEREAEEAERRRRSGG